jgi:Domain of unknown function (DUF4926)
LTAGLPNGDRATLDLRKIADYCLNLEHARGRHKARVFREALGIERVDAAGLRDEFLEAARDGVASRLAGRRMGKPLASRHRDVATEQARRGKNDMDRTARRTGPPFCNLLGVVMVVETQESVEAPPLLGAVALLSDLPTRGLVRGQVGTIVEALDDATSLVEFCDDQGRAYAITPCPREALLVLRTIPRAA